MPIRNGVVYCINHPDVEMLPNRGFNALIRMSRSSLGATFDQSQGAPVLMYSCPDCGYVELYAAQKTSNWITEERETSRNALEGIDFELQVLRALTSSNVSPFPTPSIEIHPVTRRRGFEIDALVQSVNAVFLIEIKSGISLGSLQSVTQKLQRAREVYEYERFSSEPVIPVLITSVRSRVPVSFDGIPVLRFDPSRSEFADLDAFVGILKALFPTVGKQLEQYLHSTNR